MRLQKVAPFAIAPQYLPVSVVKSRREEIRARLRLMSIGPDEFLHRGKNFEVPVHNSSAGGFVGHHPIRDDVIPLASHNAHHPIAEDSDKRRL